VAVAVPLVRAAVLMRALRDHGRLRGRLSAVAAGLVAGALPWIVEAEVRFGGVRNRLAEADEVQGGLRAVFSLRAHLTALDGPLLCRPCTGDGVLLPVTEWWVLLPLLVGLGLWTERRARRSTAPLWLAVAVAAAAPYLFLVPYAAPRFLLPAYALLALPAAVGILAVVHGARARRSRPAAAALALALLGHWGSRPLSSTLMRASNSGPAETGTGSPLCCASTGCTRRVFSRGTVRRSPSPTPWVALSRRRIPRRGPVR
jgi:hypothetical protein